MSKANLDPYSHSSGIANPRLPSREEAIVVNLREDLLCSFSFPQTIGLSIAVRFTRVYATERYPGVPVASMRMYAYPVFELDHAVPFPPTSERQL